MHTLSAWRSILLIILCCLINASYTSLAASETIVRVFSTDSPPLTEFKQDKVVGIMPELLEKIAVQEDWQLEWVRGEIKDIPRLIQEGKLDLIPAAAYSDERAQLMAFSNQPVYTIWGQVNVSATNDSIQSLPDLSNKRIAIIAGGLYGEVVQQQCAEFQLLCEFVKTENIEASYQLLAKNEVDAVVTTNFGTEFGKVGTPIRETGIVFSARGILFASPKNARISVLSQLDETIKLWRSQPNSVYYQILERWTNPQILQARKGLRTNEKFKTYALYIVGLLLYAFLIMRIMRQRKIVQDLQA